MATIAVGAYNGKTRKPILWYCIDCEEAFAPPRMSYTQKDLAEIERRFQDHSAEKHPGTAVIGVGTLES